MPGYITEFLWSDERESSSAVKKIYEYNSWMKAYALGYREPRFPVPAPLWVSDTAIGHTKLSDCVCCFDIIDYIDQLYDDIHISQFGPYGPDDPDDLCDEGSKPYQYLVDRYHNLAD